MTNTIAAVMRHLRNYFERDCYEGEITIRGGVVTPSVSAPYVYISGSDAHDGVKKLAGGAILEDSKGDETFTGRMWTLHPPDDFLALCESIAAYEEKNPVGALASETLNEYSYTKQNNGRGGVMTWEEAFAARLVPYRRMFKGVG